VSATKEIFSTDKMRFRYPRSGFVITTLWTLQPNWSRSERNSKGGGPS